MGHAILDREVVAGGRGPHLPAAQQPSSRLHQGERASMCARGEGREKNRGEGEVSEAVLLLLLLLLLLLCDDDDDDDDLDDDGTEM